jgi:hypothetical protein
MRPKKQRLTFFNKKSEALNATILDALSQYCSNCIFSLTGIDYSNLYRDRKDVVMAPRSGDFLNLIRDNQVVAGPNSFLIEAYSWARRYDALFEKNASLRLNIDREAVALEKFIEAEEQCRLTNLRFNSSIPSGTIRGISANSIIHRLRRKIKGYLGEAPWLEDLHCSFGPGSSTTCKQKTSAKWKLSSQLAVSIDARADLPVLASLYPRLEWETLVLGRGDLSFVPKSAKTHRSIMVEPLLNTFVQRGIGSVMKRRLSRAGCNLYDQSINRSFAMQGSRNGSFATVDLSSASDNISSQVVRTLLPEDWFELLATWRTGTAYYKKENRVFVLEKFSSMGNGFTFELESCIFYAAAQLSCELAGIQPIQKHVTAVPRANRPVYVRHASANVDAPDIAIAYDVFGRPCAPAIETSFTRMASAYGDDIIVPTDAVTILYEILAFLGFTVNEAKSFSDGPFRESCGGDFLLGVDVRPFYVKDSITDARLTAMSNQVCRSGIPDQGYRQLIESFINPRNQKFGPEGYGDGHLVGHDWKRIPTKRDCGYEGYVFKTFTKRPKRDISEPSGFGMLPFYLMHMKDAPLVPCAFARESDVHALRGGETARVIRVYVPPLVE